MYCFWCGSLLISYYLCLTHLLSIVASPPLSLTLATSYFLHNPPLTHTHTHTHIHTHTQGASRQPGDRWMIRGPQEYVPSVELEVVNKQKAIPLDENEGIYVRDIKTGKVYIYNSTCVKQFCLCLCTFVACTEH